MSDIKRMVAAATGEGQNIIAEKLEQTAARLRNPGGRASNPDEDEEEAENEDNSDEDDESEDDLDPAEMFHRYADGSAEENLACAVGAYRALGVTGEHAIGYNKKSGHAVMGPADEMDDELYEWSEELGIDMQGWRKMTDPAKIMACDYDHEESCDLLAQLCDGDVRENLDAAADNYEKFNWNHASRRVSHVDIPGITLPLYELGDALQVDYRSDKDSKGAGQTKDFTHQHGEETGKLPKLYALGPDTLIIHGGNMHIAPEGIRD